MNKATTSPGLRIRELRLSKGLKQGELAQRAGISASYLNLIEYNRRKAKPETVAALAAALGLEADAILGADRSDLVDELAAAALGQISAQPEEARTTEFIARFPGWADLVAAQSRQIRDQAAAIAALYERNNFDPRLQATLHEMLTNITAIRSTASILAKGDDLSPAQSQRFQANVYDQSVRLSDATAGLLSFFEAAKDTPKEAATALEAYELFLSGNDHIFDVLEDPQDAAKTIEALLNNDPLLRASESKARARVRLEIYAQDAQQLPLAAFAAKATELAFAPLALSQHFGVDLFSVFRRLSVLARPGIDAPRFGLVIINAAGHPIFRRPLKELSVPRFVSICALWPVFAALSTPNQPMEDIMELHGKRQFLARSYAMPMGTPAFGTRATLASAMLVVSLSEARAFGLLSPQTKPPIVAAGTTCKLCERQDCPARSEPRLLSGAALSG